MKYIESKNCFSYLRFLKSLQKFDEEEVSGCLLPVSWSTSCQLMHFLFPVTKNSYKGSSQKIFIAQTFGINPWYKKCSSSLIWNMKKIIIDFFLCKFTCLARIILAPNLNMEWMQVWMIFFSKTKKTMDKCEVAVWRKNYS